MKILLFLPVILLASAWRLPQEFRDYRTLQEAYTLYRKGDYSGAEQRYRETLAETPPVQTLRNSFALRFNLAGTLAMQKKYRPARTIYRNLAMNNAAGEIRNASLYNEGNCLAEEALETGNSTRKRAFFEQALQRYRTVLRDEPGNTDARINYEIVLRMLDKPEKSSTSKQENRQDRTATASSSYGRMNAAERLLRHAQMQENRTMRRIPQASFGEKQIRSGGKDW